METIGSVKNDSSIKSIFEAEINTIQNEIDNFGEGGARHIAVISEPFSGINHILDIIAGENSQKIEDIKLFSPVRDPEFFTNFYCSKNIVMLRNSQYLYRRNYGGFEVFKSFLDIISSTDKLFITGWNRFAWDYLKEISSIDKLFPVMIDVPQMDSKSLKRVIMSNIDEKIEFIDDRDYSENKRFWLPVQYRVDIPLLSTSEIRLFKPNFGALRRKKELKSMEELQNEVFLKITELAKGKYDLAQTIWKKSLKDNEIRMSRIPEPPSMGVSDLEEGFVLSIILSMGAVTYDDLLMATRDEVNLKQILYRLESPGLIERTNNSYSINPEAVNFIISHLKKNRVVW